MTMLGDALRDAGMTPPVIVEAPPAPEPKDTRPWKVVTHYHPDTDALCCLWAAVRFVVKDDEHQICFVRAGQGLPAEDAEGFRVLEMDTGKGELDQHEKSLQRSSSFELLCKKYGLTDDPGIKPIIEMTLKADNVEQMSLTETHFVFRGLAYQHTDRKTKEVDWDAVCNYAFITLDILYGQSKQRAKSSAELEQFSHRYELLNGIVLRTTWWKPQLREAAFEAGADVVMFTQNIDRKAKQFYVGIQVNRKSGITLNGVMAGIRIAEAEKRKVDTTGCDLRAVGNDPRFGGWFLHDSLKLIACGTRGHPLEEGQFTLLDPQDILKILRERLGKLPKRN